MVSELGRLIPTIQHPSNPYGLSLQMKKALEVGKKFSALVLASSHQASYAHSMEVSAVTTAMAITLEDM